MKKRFLGVFSGALLLTIATAPVVTSSVFATMAIDRPCSKNAGGCRPAAPWRYNDEYVFPITKGMRDGCSIPALCGFALPITVAADIAILPFGLIVGFAGE